jgi:hypothetical protein
VPQVNYFELGGDKQLNEIVFAGSHDAGITSGGKNVKTQSLDIEGQAHAGVRIFDLRVAATSGAKVDGVKTVELKSFHAPGLKNETKTRHLPGVGTVEVERSKFKSGGDWGMGLTDILDGARRFVQSDAGKSEFLLLKFDKSTNWTWIAEACVRLLGNTIYKGGGNLNTTKLKDLQGKVVVLFSGSGANECRVRFGPEDGILTWKNLYDKETGNTAYDPKHVGLQYYGKGGTTLNPTKNKLDANIKKQGKLLQGAKAFGLEEVLRMMYWTSTGLLESIEKRNDGMWQAPNVVKMQKLWKEGLEEYIEYTNPLALPEGSPAVGPTRKRYMPNIVMIDFADDAKCQIIRALNDLSPNDLAQL